MEQSIAFFTILVMVAIPILLLIFLARFIVRFFINIGRKMKESEEKYLQERRENSYEVERESTRFGSIHTRIPFDKTAPYDGKFLNFKEFSIFVIIQEQPEVSNEDEDEVLADGDYYDYFDNHLVFHDRYAWAEFLQKYSGDMTKFSKVLIFKKTDVFRD